MQVITYLGFTVLSVFIQFCVMDFIHEKMQNNLESDNNITHQQKLVDALLKNISSKPHAIYYRTHMSRSLKKSAALNSFTERMFNNGTVPVLPLGTTDVSTTIFDILYDENTSTTTDITPTTEQFFTTTDFDNITEITFFETKNKTSTKPNTQPKINFSKYCGCNLLYKVCDISCCCDPDCTVDELKYFQCEEKRDHRLDNDGCIAHLLHADLRYGSATLDSLFCVVKTNLPKKRGIKKPNLAQIGHYNKWKNTPPRQKLFEFKKTLYKQAEPIWLLKNGTVYYLDLPTPMISSYCSDRAPVTFLKVEMIQCFVKFNDLEMFHISKTAEESMVISATESTINSTVLNCSNLHCINWTILACYNGACVNYDKNLNEASCTDNTCTNLALKVDYYFHYNQAKITNATIKLHMKNITDMLPYMSQEISVKFIMTNKSLDSVIEFSGNPGYISYLPVIVSNAKSNFTDNFFNCTSKGSSLMYPENYNGFCIMLSNSSHNVIRFGLNKRTKCRYVHKHPILTRNNTSVCKNIQDNINELLHLNRELHISPFGNPYSIKDEQWLELKMELNNKEVVHGEYSENMSKLHCYNLINRVSIIFIFAKVDEHDFTDQNKILSAKYEVNAQNVSFNLDDISTVLTVDINFIDSSKPSLYVYAGSPHLNIHLPKDFFFPFPPNNGYRASNSRNMVTFFCCVIFLTNKILFE